VLIGVYLGSVEVAYFDVAEKVVSIFKLPITLYGQVIFPGFVKDRSTKLIIQSIVLFIGLHILFIGGIYFYSEDILKILTGMNDIEMYAKSTITILSLALIPILFNVFLGNTVLFGLGYQNQYSVTLIVGGIVYCVIGIWIFYNNAWSLQNMAWMVLCSELGCFTMTTIFFLLQKKPIQSKLSQ
jgi:PST family polysaccharide transporter